jgi:hypothetical protein
MLLGLASVLDGLSFRAEGQRVAGALRIPASKRDLIADKVLAVLQALASNRGSR